VHRHDLIAATQVVTEMAREVVGFGVEFGVAKRLSRFGNS
jgi:hypothetical protein